MNNKQQFDFWYAVNNTELVVSPSNRLETFGDTIVNYHLICELMDSVGKVRIREGQLKALKPEIIMPQSLGQMDLEEFGQDAEQYAQRTTPLVRSSSALIPLGKSAYSNSWSISSNILQRTIYSIFRTKLLI